MVVKEAVKTRKFVCLLVIDLMEAGNVLMEAGNVRQSLEKRSKGAMKKNENCYRQYFRQ